MSYTVMSDEILKELDSKIYYAITEIRNDRKRNDRKLQDRVDRLLKNGTFLNKPKRDKDSQRLNIDKIDDPSINISSLSTHSLLAASSTTYRLSIQTQT